MEVDALKESLKLIYHTPMYQIEHSNIFVKLEKYNLGGSVKDRAVHYMLKGAQERNELHKNTILVEATSGNTGISLAMFGTILGYKVVLFMPESMSKERRDLIKAYGAQLILTPKAEGMQGSIDAMKAFCDHEKNAYQLDQFNNRDNVRAHYETSAKEIIEQCPAVDIFVCGIGTGGSFSGIAKGLKEYRADIFCVAGEPSESPVLSGQKAGVHRIQGIGANFKPKNFDATLCDDIMLIHEQDALDTMQTFVKESGIFVGVSSGANIALARRLAKYHPDKNIVTLAPDGGEKYLSMLETSL